MNHRTQYSYRTVLPEMNWDRESIIKGLTALLPVFGLYVFASGTLLPGIELVIGVLDESILVYSGRSLWLVLSLGLPLLVFRENITELASARFLKLGIFALLVLFLSGFSMHSTYHENWHSGQTDTMWGLEEPRIHRYSEIDYDQALIRFEIQSPENRLLNITLNDQNLIQVMAGPEETSYTRLIDLETGINTFSFETESGCTFVELDGTSRCVTVGLENTSIAQPSQRAVYTGQNVSYTDGGYIVEGEGNIYLYGRGNFSLGLETYTGKNGILELSTPDIVLAKASLQPGKSRLSTPYREINGFKRIKLETSCGSCKLEINELNFTMFREQPEDLLYRPGVNWSSWNSNNYSWSSGNSSIRIYNYGEKMEKIIWIEGKSAGRPRNITYRFNGEKLGTRMHPETSYRTAYRLPGRLIVPQTYPMSQDNQNLMSSAEKVERVKIDNKYGFKVELQPGENTLELKTSGNCSVVEKRGKNTCSIFGFKNLYLTDDWS